MSEEPFEILVVAVPGLEQALFDEMRGCGFTRLRKIQGGVTFMGGWPDVWRANLELRGASRVLARIGDFRAVHLAQLDKRARKFNWGAVLRPDVPIRVEVTSRKSKIYHQGAAAERIGQALREELGVAVTKDAALVLKTRIDDDLVTLSIDTSGEGLHKRGHKQAVGKAPMRETMAALFLAQCGFCPDEPLLDPMCGSGTFPIEAAEIAAGLQPGRDRRFAFEDLVSFDPQGFAGLRRSAVAQADTPRFFGSDRDEGAIAASRTNAERAGVSTLTAFQRAAVSEIVPPVARPGLVIVNPPYGARIGERKQLFGLYGALGARLKERFQGWRVGLVTSDAGLAHATGLSFAKPIGPVSNGGLRINLFYCDEL